MLYDDCLHFDAELPMRPNLILALMQFPSVDDEGSLPEIVQYDPLNVLLLSEVIIILF